MKLAVIGTGYVGLVAGVCFAEAGNDVIGVDVNQEKLARLRAGEIPIYEPGLEHLFNRNTREERLIFTDDLAHAVAQSEIIFLALPTPPGAGGAADLKYVLGASRDIGKLLKEGAGYKIIVTKSTVPVGTVDKVRAAIAENAEAEFDVISNPEFLREGVAVEDFMKPDRVVIGIGAGSPDPARAEAMMRELYHSFLLSGNPLLVMDARSAEITKYAANSMLALRISFMNDIATLCEKCGADVDKVRLGIGVDSRIGRRFLFAGTGYGGSCFPKDVQALIATGQEHGAPQAILEATEAVNARQKTTLIPRIEAHFGADLTGKTFALWGLAFKPNTDDIREAPALEILDQLISRGASVVAYDPEAAIAVAKHLGDKYGEKLRFTPRHYEACDGADALVIATEWPKFREPDFHYLRELLNEPTIFDGRNVYELDTMRREKFNYYSIGRPIVKA
ncbi:UDP-glucose dehydrogenase [Abditibacterium utsteinense]|uniref:UDP-glucose 6-dehydrogenase n=1 Tax=Abditibacterium utsteinense TaxID=1960156 RepID=A0A2S8SU26_9BACT|nr:UDP-glucose/GDP-mannose dehydrogenase family protein [Abditibacterium utsteinense]PQV64302.1 UDP-glucose dehydrogenase [Abditibacterium utsteinense]